MSKLLKHLKGDFFGNISIQLIGTGIAQLIPFLVSPILTRLYPEKAFANLAFFMAVAALLIVPNGGRYFYAIVVPKEDSEANDLAGLSLWIVLVYNSLLLAIVLLSYDQLNQIYNLGPMWYLVPFYVAIYGIYNIALYSSVRNKTFRINAFAKIVQTASTAIFSIVVSFSGMLFSGLVIGKTLGVLSSIPALRIRIKLNSDFSRFKAVARKYIDYPRITIVPSLLDVFSLQALVFFVGKHYSEQTLGYIGLTNMILVAPLALIGISFRDVFYQKAVALYHDRAYSKARKLFFGSAAVLFLIGGCLALILYLFGESIFSFVYGENWILSGTFASILGVAFWAKLCTSPLSSIFNATNRLRNLSIWQSTYFFTTISTLFISISYFKLPIEELLMVYTLHEVVLYTLYFLMQKHTLNQYKIV